MRHRTAILYAWAVSACAAPPPGPSARARYAPAAAAIGAFGPALRPGPGSAPTDLPAAAPLTALEGGGWALRDLDGTLHVVDPARGVVARTSAPGRPTPDGRWLLPDGPSDPVRLDPAPMSGVRRVETPAALVLWSDTHAVEVRSGPRGAIGGGPLDGCVGEAVWSPDGRRAACEAPAGFAVFDARGRLVGVWDGFDPERAVWAPDGERVVLLARGEGVGWSPGTGDAWRVTIGPPVPLWAVVVDDGSLVVVTDGRATAVLDAADGSRLDPVPTALVGPPHPVAPRARVDATPAPTLGEAATGRIPFDAARDSLRSVTDLAVSPDGRTLAVQDGSGVALWDLGTGVRRWRAHELGPQATVGFAPDGSVVAGSSRGTIAYGPDGQIRRGRWGLRTLALTVDDGGEVRVADRDLGWVRLDGGRPTPTDAVTSHLAWGSLAPTSALRWAMPGHAGALAPAAPPSCGDPSSVACSSSEADVTAAADLPHRSLVIPSLSGTYLLAHRRGGWIVRGPGGRVSPLALPRGAEVAWAGAGSAVAAAPGLVARIGADGRVRRVASDVFSPILAVAAGGGRMARFVPGAVLVGPAGSDRVDCLLATRLPAQLWDEELTVASSPDGRWLAWTGPGDVGVADVVACRRTPPTPRGAVEVPDEPLTLNLRRTEVRRGDAAWSLRPLGVVSAVGSGPGDTVAALTLDGVVHVVPLDALPPAP